MKSVASNEKEKKIQATRKKEEKPKIVVESDEEKTYPESNTEEVDKNQ